MAITVKVGADGKAPTGLNAGDKVVTGGGTYTIGKVNADGSYSNATKTSDMDTYHHTGSYDTVTPNATAPTPQAAPAAPNYLPQMESQLNQGKEAAEQQAKAAADYATKQGIDELQRAQDDAQVQYNTQRNQIAADTAKAQDNSALYSEARGDRGGIGQAQYNSISAAALKAKQEVSSAQTKLSTDTARQISDLRAKGEFEKADKVLEIAQNYLSQLVSLEQWQANYGLSYQQFQSSLDQWQKQYDLSVAQASGKFADGTKTYEAQADEKARLASLGEALLQAGIPPSPAQLAAMDMTEEQAKQRILAQKLAKK